MCVYVCVCVLQLCITCTIFLSPHFWNDGYAPASVVRFCSWAEPDVYWSAEDGFNDGRVELFQQLLWQFELPQLAKATTGPFSQWSLCDCPTSGPGRWWCPRVWMTPLQSQCCSWWWVERGVSPEVHDHLHCFDRVKPRLLRLHQTALTSCL